MSDYPVREPEPPLFQERSMPNGLQVREATPLSILQLAVERGADPDQLEKLLALQERWEANQAAKDFGAAIAEFQARCPKIAKSREADAGKYKYRYAGFEDVMDQAGPILKDCGLAVTFSTESNDRGIRVTCRIRHGVHAENHTLDVPIPQMVCNDTQKYGAALSYAKRYAMCAALNIVCGDDVDNDAVGCLDGISDAQALEIEAFITDHGINAVAFLKWLEVEKVSDIAARDFGKAMAGLRAKAKELSSARG